MVKIPLISLRGRFFSTSLLSFFVLAFAGVFIFYRRRITSIPHADLNSLKVWGTGRVEDYESDAVSLNADDDSPRPIFVVIGGAQRTGSTVVFNALRILMRIRDPNTISSSNRYYDVLVPGTNKLKALKTTGSSILLKIHTDSEYHDFVGSVTNKNFAENVDLLVMTHRDLRSGVLSAYRKFPELTETEESLDEMWVTACRMLVAQRKSVLGMIGPQDSTPIVEIRYENWKNGSNREMLSMVRQLGKSIPWKYTEDDYVRTVDELKRLRGPPRGPVNGPRIDWHFVNLMGRHHVAEGNLSQDIVNSAGRAVEGDPLCNQFLQEQGY